MKKRSGYKYQMEQELINNHWETIEIGSRDIWWEPEYWVITTIYDRTISIYLSFKADPCAETYPKITEVMALNNDIENKPQITSLCMRKRKFNSKLDEFITDLNTFRNTIKYQYENNSRS